MAEYDQDRLLSRRSAIWLCVSALVLTLIRLGIAIRGFFYSDDFGLLYRAWTRPLDADFALQSYNGHVNPVGWALAWSAQRLWPGSHLGVVAIQALLWFGVLLLAAYLVLQLTRSVWPALIAMTVLSVSAFQWEVSLWWSASIYALPYQALSLLSLSLLVKWRVTGTRAFAWWGLVAYGAACLSFSRGAAVLLMLYIAVTALPWGPDPAWGLRSGWQRGRTIWLSFAGVGAACAVLVASRIPSEQRPVGTVTATLRAAWDLLVGNILPAVWGGPIGWLPVALPDGWPSVLAVPSPSPLVQVVSAGLTVALVVWLVLRRPELRAYAAGAVTWLVFVAVVAAAARTGNPLASPAYRYTFDAVWPAVLLMAVLLRRPASGWHRGPLVVAAVLVTVSVVSSLVPVTLWAQNRGNDYVNNARGGFEEMAGSTVLAQGVPKGLVEPLLLAPYANTYAVLGPQKHSPQFGLFTAGPLWGFSAEGTPQRQSVSGPTAPEGPDKGCGYAVTSSPRSIPLQGALIDWDFYARVAYFTGTPVTLNMAVGGSITSVPLQSGGLREVYFPVKGPGRDVLVSVSDPKVTVCLTELTIGNRTGPDGTLVPTPAKPVVP